MVKLCNDIMWLFNIIHITCWQMFTTTSQAHQHFAGTLAAQRIAASRWPPSVKHRRAGVRVWHDFKVTNSGRPSLIVPFILQKKNGMNRNEIASKRKTLARKHLQHLKSYTKKLILAKNKFGLSTKASGKRWCEASCISDTHHSRSHGHPSGEKAGEGLQLPSLSASSARMRHCSASRLGWMKSVRRLGFVEDVSRSLCWLLWLNKCLWNHMTLCHFKKKDSKSLWNHRKRQVGGHWA